MADARYCVTGKCNLCGHTDEGILFEVWWFIKLFVCETCMAELFKRFRKGR